MPASSPSQHASHRASAIAQELETMAYALAGHVDLTMTSQLVLISQDLGKILRRLEKSIEKALERKT